MESGRRVEEGAAGKGEDLWGRARPASGGTISRCRETKRATERKEGREEWAR